GAGRGGPRRAGRRGGGAWFRSPVGENARGGKRRPLPVGCNAPVRGRKDGRGSLLRRRAVAERQQGEAGGQVGGVLAERLVGLVDPAAVGALPLLDRLEQFLAPVVLLAGGVLELVLAQCGHGLGEGVVVVIQPALPLAGVLVQGVVLADPADRRLDARVVAGHPGVEEALQPGVGHGAQRAQAAGGGLVRAVV